MTDTVIRPEESTATTGPVRRPTRPRRLLIPLAVAVLLIVLTMVATLIEAPNPGSEDFLSPISTADDGAATLSADLAAAGVTVHRHTDPEQAFRAASGLADEGVTMFVPAPEHVNTAEWGGVMALQYVPRVRTVLVDPPTQYLASTGLRQGSTRIATDVVPPGDGGECGFPEADRAGPAAMLRQRYRPSEIADRPSTQLWRLCYDGGLAVASSDGNEQIVAGAPDVFDNGHLGQAGNRALALALLGSQPHLVWLDHHRTNPLPQATAQSRPDHERPEQPIQYPQARDTNPIYDVFPGWSWALLVGLLVLGALVAVWRGRRLGPPVTEALPVTVPSAETVYGRARLYRRARAWPQAARAIRSGARQRLADALRLRRRVDDTRFAAAVAAATGRPVDRVTWLLFGPDPTGEPELRTIVDGLDVLLSVVEKTHPQGRQ